MKRALTLLGISVLLVNFLGSGAQAAAPKAGSSCSKVGASTVAGGFKFTCIKSKQKLVWGKPKLLTPPSKPKAPSTDTTSPAPKPSSSPMPATPAIPTSYFAKDQKNLRHLIANEGCANANNSTAEVQALVNEVWVKVTSIKSGWLVLPNNCPIAQLGKKDSLAWVDLYLDPGVTYRWSFTGEVNIEHHDGNGHGISKSQSIPLPVPVVTPHAPVGGYGLTWQNITSHVQDISAAAYTDAHATIARNQGLPNASSAFTTYISPGALQIYPAAENAPSLMRRTFSLFANYPHASQVFYIGTTQEEKDQTFTKLDTLYADNGFMKQSIDSIYGINTGEPAGSVFTRPTCTGVDSGRNTVTWNHVGAGSAVLWSFCPTENLQVHVESDHGAAHEYAHTIQIQMYRNGNLGQLQPCWMTEGEVEWAQTAVSSNFSEYIAMEHFHPYYLTATGLNYSQPSQTTWTAAELDTYFKGAILPGCNETPVYALAYSAGAIAIEALVALGGSESFFAVDQRISNGEKFVDAFNEVYGVTWDYAEPIIAEVVAQKLTKVNSPDASTYQTRPTE